MVAEDALKISADRGRKFHPEGWWKRLEVPTDGSKIAEAKRKGNEFLVLQAEATTVDAKWQRIEEGLAEIVPLPRAWADAMEDELDASTRVRICGFEANDDPVEEGARPEGELVTDD